MLLPGQSISGEPVLIYDGLDEFQSEVYLNVIVKY
tara:strand:+ start:18637 stop:18741 length:105 start_codon:yes stop_codon:yes gene_type:complete